MSAAVRWARMRRDGSRTRGRGRRTRVAQCLLLPAMLSVSGCASDAGTRAAGTGRSAPDPLTVADPAARFAHAESGLLVQILRVADDPRRIPVLLSRAARRDADPAASAAVIHAPLDAAGVRLLRIPESSIVPLLTEFGEVERDAATWHGEAPNWRPIALGILGREGPVDLDGTARPFPPGEFRLLVRAWTMPMEDGPRLQVELVPEFEPAGASVELLPAARSKRRRPFLPLRAELMLDAGEALLLTVVRDDDVWDADAVLPPPGRAPLYPAVTPVPDPDGADAERDRVTGAVPDEGGSARSPDPPGSRRTLGRLLFSPRASAPVREIVLLRPRIAEHATVAPRGDG